MKLSSIVLCSLLLSAFGLMGCGSEKSEMIPGPNVTDADGNEYPTVKIGNQLWMAKNLNVNIHGSVCYYNDPANCEKFGRLYTWGAAKMACPSGWHLPSREEFDSFLATVGASEKEQSKNLRAGSWENGKDKYGFSALPAGVISSRAKFDYLGDYTRFWSSTAERDTGAYYLSIARPNADVFSDNEYQRRYSVRCLQDSNEGGEVTSQEQLSGENIKESHVANSVTASKTLPESAKASYNADNLLDSDAKTVWAATFEEEPITLTFNTNNATMSSIYVANGYRKDAMALQNNSQAKNVDIYINGEKVKTVELAEVNDLDENSEIIDLGREYSNVQTFALEITSIYPGKKWNDICIADVGYYGNSAVQNSQDAQTFKTVKIGNQVWMAKNLNVDVPGSMCYDNDPDNCVKYGRLYTWGAANMACPSGWHLPSRGEFKSLLTTVGASDKNLRAGSWDNGKDKYGFSALPAGSFNSADKQFGNLDCNTYFCSSTEDTGNGAYYLSIGDYDAGVYSYGKGLGCSVRCIRN